MSALFISVCLPDGFPDEKREVYDGRRGVGRDGGFGFGASVLSRGPLCAARAREKRERRWREKKGGESERKQSLLK